MNLLYYLPLGFVVGVLFRRFMLSVKSGNTFAESILPTMRALQIYSDTFIKRFSSDVAAETELEERRYQLERALTTRKGMYPEWIYKAGFNPRLRAGTRSYLIRLERVVELLFSTEFILNRYPSANELFNEDLELITNVIQVNNELMNYLLSYFSGRPVMTSDRDYTTDVKKLEDAVSKQVPGSLDLLDMAPEYLDRVSLVRNLKDLRQVLLNLVSSLPA